MDAAAVRQLETKVLLLILQTVIAELLRRSGNAETDAASASASASAPSTPPLEGYCGHTCGHDGCQNACLNRDVHTVHRCAYHRSD